MKKVTLNVSQISHPNDLQLREALDTDHISELAAVLKADGALPPVRLVKDGNTYWLWDGHHTLAAHQEAGITAIDCEVTQDGTRQDARWLACSANATHGLKRSPETKRRQVEAALKLRPSETARAIARHVGVDHSYVSRLRSPSGDKSPDAPTTRIVTRGGKTYEQDTSNIGKANKDRAAAKEAEKAEETPPAEPEPEPPTTDPDSMEAACAGLDRVAAKVREAANIARAVFRVKGQEIQAPWLGRFSWTGAIGSLNQYQRMLDDLRPVGGTKNKPVTNRDAKAEKALNK